MSRTAWWPVSKTATIPSHMAAILRGFLKLAAEDLPSTKSPVYPRLALPAASPAAQYSARGAGCALHVHTFANFRSSTTHPFEPWWRRTWHMQKAYQRQFSYHLGVACASWLRPSTLPSKHGCGRKRRATCNRLGAVEATSTRASERLGCKEKATSSDVMSGFVVGCCCLLLTFECSQPPADSPVQGIPLPHETLGAALYKAQRGSG